MNIKLNSRKREMILVVQVLTKRPQRIRLRVKDAYKPNTYYTNRYKTVRGKKTFYVRMPQSPSRAIIQVFNEKNGNLPKGVDRTFKVAKLKVIPLKKHFCPEDAEDMTTRSFIDFAKDFSENAGILSAHNSIYRSDGGDFRIDYLNVIRNRKTGKKLNTPARISRSRGVIEVSKKHYKRYTVPMRLAILFHEYSHFWLNVDSTSEMEADINGLIIYLGLGYPRIEGQQAFLDVFKKAPTDLNKKRYKLLNSFIKNFDSLQLRRCAA